VIEKTRISQSYSSGALRMPEYGARFYPRWVNGKKTRPQFPIKAQKMAAFVAYGWQIHDKFSRFIPHKYFH
jgi:hypothetical protein